MGLMVEGYFNYIKNKINNSLTKTINLRKRHLNVPSSG
jgi:hypothetical protein